MRVRFASLGLIDHLVQPPDQGELLERQGPAKPRTWVRFSPPPLLPGLDCWRLLAQPKSEVWSPPASLDSGLAPPYETAPVRITRVIAHMGVWITVHRMGLEGHLIAPLVGVRRMKFPWW